MARQIINRLYPINGVCPFCNATIEPGTVHFGSPDRDCQIEIFPPLECIDPKEIPGPPGEEEMREWLGKCFEKMRKGS